MREVERVGEVDEDLALDVGRVGGAEGVKRGRSRGGVHEQLAEGGGVGEAARRRLAALVEVGRRPDAGGRDHAARTEILRRVGSRALIMTA